MHNWLHSKNWMWTILSRVLVCDLQDGVLDWMIGFIAPCTFTQFGTMANTALSLIYTLCSSPFHTHWDSVFTNRILATGLSQSLCNFKSHVKSSGHSLIPLSCPYSATANSENSTLLPSSYPGRLASRSSTTVLYPVASYKFSGRTPQKTAYIVDEACVAMCLPTRCLSMDIHVTIHKTNNTPK
jgi:hypothetical protein